MKASESCFLLIAALISSSLVLIQATDVTWGSTCSFTPESRSTEVDLLLNEEKILTTIPKGKEKVFIKLSGHVDIDTKIVAADGTVLVQYVNGAGWIGGCVGCPESQAFTYNEMNFITCVDKCTSSASFTYHDGTVWNFQGTNDYSQEWVYIDSTTEDLTLSLVGYEEGCGTVQWLWDCQKTCGTCLAYGEKPPPATCFHGDDLVSLESGELRPFVDVQIGDRILSADAHGNFSFSPVLELPHGENSELVAFLEIVTAKGKRLNLTPDHLLPRCSGEVVTARSMAVGDCVLTVDGSEVLASISAAYKAGVYTAITANKFIVVDQIVVSPFGQDRDSEREFKREQRRDKRQEERKLQRQAKFRELKPNPKETFTTPPTAFGDGRDLVKELKQDQRRDQRQEERKLLGQAKASEFKPYTPEESITTPATSIGQDRDLVKELKQEMRRYQRQEERKLQRQAKTREVKPYPKESITTPATAIGQDRDLVKELKQEMRRHQRQEERRLQRQAQALDQKPNPEESITTPT